MSLVEYMVPTALSGNDWTAIGSLGTAVAALIALGSLLVARQTRQAAEAAQIRERVQAFATKIQHLFALLKDGSPLISAAWHTACSLRTQAGKQATGDSLRRLIGDSSSAVTAAIEGWASSPSSAELRALLAELIASDRGLSGHLSLFSPTAELVRGIVSDGYSDTLFIKLLTGEPAHQFASENPHDDLDGLTRSLAAHLQGNASAYFMLRYESALESIQSFVDIAASAIGDLESASLVRAARAKSPIATYPTHTEELRAKVERLKGILPRETLDRLAADVSVIEAAICKDAAMDRLDAEQVMREDDL
jgi:hypothetical protein